MVTGIIAASLLTPFFLEVTPEVRSTYQSLGKIVEDRPMQVTSASDMIRGASAVSESAIGM